MRFETIIIAIAIGILALVVGISAIGSFSTEYGLSYTDEYSNLGDLANKTYQVSSGSYDAVKNTSVMDAQDNVVTASVNAVIRFGSYIGIAYSLLQTTTSKFGLNKIFLDTIMIAIIVTVSWTAVYLFRGAFPPK